jgi:hypothetical protein
VAPAAIAALGLAYLGTRSAPEPQPTAEKPVAARSRDDAASAKPALEVAADEKPPAKPVAEGPAALPGVPAATVQPQPAEPAARKQSPSGVTTKPAPPGATRVRLEVHPPDSKVGRRGVTQKPPYEFDVPKGKKVVLEVLRKGYTTRKVTLDGSSSRVVVGLARARSARGTR